MSLPSPWRYSAERCSLGLCYIGLHSWGKWALGEYFSQPHLMLGDGAGFLLRTARLWAWAKVHLALYVGIFLLADGACALSGAGYNGVDPRTGEVMWDGMSNVRVYLFEIGSKSFHVREWHLSENEESEH